jgi:polar amino acid transport system permease protein/putative glutamine transport system permease protein
LSSLYFGDVFSNTDILLRGLGITFLISIGSLLLSLIIALPVAFIRNSHIRSLRFLSSVYVEFFRNTPLLAQLFFFFYGLPELGIDTNAIVVSIIAIGLNTGAYNSEVIRAGLLSVDKGLIDASYALGMSQLQSTVYVVLPNAFRVAFKPLSSTFINMVLGTSTAASVTANELMNSGVVLAGNVFRPFEIYSTIFVGYCLLTFALSFIAKFADYHLISKHGQMKNALKSFVNVSG